MIFQSQTRPRSSSPSYAPRIARRLLQRKCACGGTPGPSGECAECKRKRLSLQSKLAINQPGDQYEQEADRVAEAVVSGGTSHRPSISSLGSESVVQREEPAKPKTEEEKYKEAAKKVGEAFLESAPGKEIKKKAEELGDAFISTLPGKIITGAAVAGAVATLAATHKELPIGIPEIPLDKIKPGLKMKITYDGPVDKPTKVMATFSFTLGAGTREKKPALTESEKFRAETARMAAEQAKFREGLKTPEEKAAEQRMFDAYIRSKMLGPGQLTPRPSPLSFGIAGEELGFKPGIPSQGAQSGLGPWSPNLKLADEERPAKEEPKKKEEETLQRKSAGQNNVSAAPPIVDEVLESPGQPLDTATRAFMERRFGHDFSQVRVHTDARAGESSRAVEAHAYTVGRDVVFGAGQYSPLTSEGRRLVAHELAHVAQQRAAPPIETEQGQSVAANLALSRSSRLTALAPVIQRKRHLLYASGFARPFNSDAEEIRCGQDRRRGGDEQCEWAPSVLDMQTSAGRSGGGTGVGSFDELLAYIEKQPADSITELGLIGHSNPDLFGFTGTIERLTVKINIPTGLNEDALAQKTGKITQLRNRFAPNARIVLFGCTAGSDPKLLTAISSAFYTCVEGLLHPILYFLGASPPPHPQIINIDGQRTWVIADDTVVTSRGKIHSGEAISKMEAFGLVSESMLLENAWELQPDSGKFCFGAPLEEEEKIVGRAQNKKRDPGVRAVLAVWSILQKYFGEKAWALDRSQAKQYKVNVVWYEEKLTGMRIEPRGEGESTQGAIVVGRKFLEGTTQEHFRHHLQMVGEALRVIDAWRAGHNKERTPWFIA